MQEASYSQRLRNRIEQPRHALTSEKRQELLALGAEGLFRERHQGPDLVVEFWGACSTEDGRLEHLAWASSVQGPLAGVLDVLCQFAIGRDRPKLLKLSAREAENYLRDQNHVPAFAHQGGEELLLENLSASFAAVVRGMGKVAANLWGQPASAQLGPSGPGLAPLVRAAEEILERYVRPSLARDQGDVALLKVSEGRIHLEARGQCSGCPSSGAGTLQFIQEVFGRELGPGIQVVME